MIRKGTANTADEKVIFNHPHKPKDAAIESTIPTTPTKPTEIITIIYNRNYNEIMT